MFNRSHHIRFIKTCLCAAVLLGVTPTAFATNPLPSTVEPGRQDPFPRRVLTPKSTIEELLPPAPLPRQEPEARRIDFELSAILLQGATAFTSEDFVSYYEDKVGKRVSLRDLKGIARKINDDYRNSGYLLARVIIPPQEISNGIVYFRVDEGFIDKVGVEGETDSVMTPLKDMAEKIARTKPIDISTLERYLLLMNDLPGLEVKSFLTPSKLYTSASDLMLRVKHKVYEGFVNLNNRGSRFLGPLQVAGGAQVNGLGGVFNKTEIQTVASVDFKKIRWVRAGHTTPIGSDGTTLSVAGTYSDSTPGSSLEALDVTSSNRALSLTVSHPLIRSRTKNMSIYGTFDYKNSRNESFGAKLSEDKLRVLRFGGSLDNIDQWRGINLFNIELSQGLGILGHTPTGAANLTRAAARTDFTKLTAEATRLQQFDKNLSLHLGVSGQYSAHALPASEEFGYGGSQYGRGYDSSEITGDHGLAAKAELRWAPPALAKIPYTREGSRLFAYADGGIVWNKDTPAQPAKQTGTSVGVGATFALRHNAAATVEIAQPIGRGVAASREDGKDPRIFFSLSKQF